MGFGEYEKTPLWLQSNVVYLYGPNQLLKFVLNLLGVVGVVHLDTC